MKFKFEVIQPQSSSKAATYIVAVVIPFWAKREDAIYHRNVLMRDLRDLKISEHAEDALFCLCHFDGTELFSPRAIMKGASIQSLSDMLVESLAAVRGNAYMEYGKPSSSSVDEEAKEVTSESDAKDHLRLPIVFITHSLASWVVRHLLSGRPYYNSSIMFATRGVVFLDTPHESFISSPKAENAEAYLTSLSSFLRGRTDTHSSTETLAKELKVIDGAFENLQNSVFVQKKKSHVVGGPAIATRFNEIWMTAPDSGVVKFQERSSTHKKIGLSRLRGLLRIDIQRVQVEETASVQSSEINIIASFVGGFQINEQVSIA
ncbi:hypothetical protein FJTKL_13938 [Diaporthe vaccinii]|uniref:Uncharacterized protein n=1 Tax=Diaporthe vaccinii TaxID=105482 RepID=A0ABR4F9W0_9PEZI